MKKKKNPELRKRKSWRMWIIRITHEDTDDHTPGRRSSRIRIQIITHQHVDHHASGCGSSQTRTMIISLNKRPVFSFFFFLILNCTCWTTQSEDTDTGDSHQLLLLWRHHRNQEGTAHSLVRWCYGNSPVSHMIGLFKTRLQTSTNPSCSWQVSLTTHTPLMSHWEAWSLHSHCRQFPPNKTPPTR